jgi:hypothetical protein
VTLVVIYGQTRILFAMGRDGMVPPIFHKLNPRTLTPVPSTVIVAVVISLLAGVLPIDFLAEMTSIGTLVAFLVVSIGVMVLRQTQPNLPRAFKVPLYPLLPILSIAGCIWIIQDLRPKTIYVFFGWSAVALLWYLFYGRRHSALGEAARRHDDGGRRLCGGRGRYGESWDEALEDVEWKAKRRAGPRLELLRADRAGLPRLPLGHDRAALAPSRSWLSAGSQGCS